MCGFLGHPVFLSVCSTIELNYLAAAAAAAAASCVNRLSVCIYIVVFALGLRKVA